MNYLNKTSYAPYVLYLSSFEESIDGAYYLDWMRDNWHVSLYFSAAYLVLVYLGQEWM